MRPVSEQVRIAMSRLRESEGWLRFVRIDLSTGGVMRLVRNSENLRGDGAVWQASSLGIDFPEEDADGRLGQISFTVSNVSRLPVAFVEVSGEILGGRVSLYIQHTGNLETFDTALKWTHRVLYGTFTEARAEFVAGHSASLQMVPGPVYDRATFPQLLRPRGGRLV